MRKVKFYRPHQWGGKTATWGVSSLASLYVESRTEMVRRAFRLLRDSHRSEEVVQDAMVKLMLAAPALENSDHARAYLFTTIDNLCKDILRQEGRRPSLISVEHIHGESESLLQSEKGPSDVLASAEDAVIVRQALSLLSPAERSALILWEIDGRSTSEIAAELGIKESSVRHTVSRARASFRRIMSSYVIDESSGLTALELLSNSYQRFSKLSKDGSRVVMSALLFVFAILGFSNISSSVKQVTETGVSSALSTSSTSSAPKAQVANQSPLKSVKESKVGALQIKSDKQKMSNSKVGQLSFSGLDANGLPMGFSITGSSDGMGLLFVSGKPALLDDGITLSWISKTISVAPNIILTQSLIQDAETVSYEPILAYGRQGHWVPLETRVVSTHIERVGSGNYLFSASLQVKSELDSGLVVPAYAGGRDLQSPPAGVVTRILLNASKTEVLAQAVLVVEKTSR